MQAPSPSTIVSPTDSSSHRSCYLFVVGSSVSWTLPNVQQSAAGPLHCVVRPFLASGVCHEVFDFAVSWKHTCVTPRSFASGTVAPSHGTTQGHPRLHVERSLAVAGAQRRRRPRSLTADPSVPAVMCGRSGPQSCGGEHLVQAGSRLALGYRPSRSSSSAWSVSSASMSSSRMASPLSPHASAWAIRVV